MALHPVREVESRHVGIQGHRVAIEQVRHYDKISAEVVSPMLCNDDTLAVLVCCVLVCNKFGIVKFVPDYICETGWLLDKALMAMAVKRVLEYATSIWGCWFSDIGFKVTNSFKPSVSFAFMFDALEAARSQAMRCYDLNALSKMNKGSVLSDSRGGMSYDDGKC